MNLQIDARGLGCPNPVLMAEEALASMDQGIVTVLVDNEAATKNLQKFARKNSLHPEVQKHGEHWSVKITKAPPVAQSIEQTQSPEIQAIEQIQSIEQSQGTLVVIGTDSLGKDEELGRTLMLGFLETMKVTREVPHTMFFLNTGVRLTTSGADTVAVLQGIEALGTEIYSCGTCLKHFGLEKELQVGHRGSTNHIVEGITDFKKVVWI